jgi:DNA-directed RNA polymerase-3 subunit RPC5
MTIKSSSNGDETITETMADRLRQVQIEGWQKLQFVHEDDNESWELFHSTLVYRGPEAADDPKGKGKAVAAGGAKDVDVDGAARLQTRWTEEDFLHAVAGKSRESVLESVGTALPGIKADDLVEDVKEEDVGAGARRPAAAAAAAKAKPATTARRAPAKAKP